MAVLTSQNSPTSLPKAALMAPHACRERLLESQGGCFGSLVGLIEQRNNHVVARGRGLLIEPIGSD